MLLPVSFVYLHVFGLLTRLSKARSMWGSNENVISKQPDSKRCGRIPWWPRLRRLSYLPPGAVYLREKHQ